MSNCCVSEAEDMVEKETCKKGVKKVSQGAAAGSVLEPKGSRWGSLCRFRLPAGAGMRTVFS